MFENTSRNSRDTQKLIAQIRSRIDDVGRRLYSFRQQLRDTEYLRRTAFQRAAGNASDEAQNILVKNATRAAESSVEYSLGLFKDGLVSACMDSRAIEARYNEGEIIVDINLDATAGELEGYAQAVKIARETMGLGKIGDPLRASYIFFLDYFSVDRLGARVRAKRKMKRTGTEYTVDVTEKYKGKYLATVATRAERFAGKAPWWRLLNDGNKNISMSSDWGGIGAPDQEPTHFVEESQKAISALIRGNYTATYGELVSNIESNIRYWEGELQQLEIDLANLLRGLESYEPPRYDIAESKVTGRLEKLGLDKIADPEKVQQLTRELARGEKPGRRRLGHGVRIRTEGIWKEIQMELRKYG